ncbi:MAG: hypothetical protein JNL96_06835, partial [Planctomycetaceae bacterium]|nr:hypothetical protein [Planctomycetaceae bacterium]
YQWRAHAAITFDVESELSQRPEPLRTPPLYKSFSLADGETAGTLFAAEGALRDRIDQLGDLNGGSGLGQLRLFGARAADILLNTAEVEQFVQQLLDHAQVVTNGHPCQADFRVLWSSAGGTGSGAGKRIADFLSREFTALEIPVTIDYDVLGPITFAGLGCRLGRNAATATADLVQHFRAKGEGRERLVTRTLSLVELPPVIHDQAARDAFLLLDEQAQAGSELQQHLHRMEPNHAVSGPLGNISIRQIDFFTELNSQQVVAPIAEAYHLQISQAVAQATPCAALVREVRQTVEKQSLPHSSLESIVERVMDVPTQEILDELSRPTEAYRATTTLVGADGEEFETERIEADFAVAPASLADAHERLRLLRSMLQATDREQSLVAGLQAELEAQYQLLLGSVEKATEKLRRGGWWTSLESRVERFLDIAAQLREIVNQLNELNVRLEALILTAHFVTREEQALSGRLTRMLAALDQHRRKGRTESRPSSILFRPINEAFAELLDLDRHTPERQQRLLQLQASAATIDGLANIVGAELPRLERIAERVVHADAAIAGPCWGGRLPQGENQLVYALPPVTPVVAERLRELIRALDPSAITVFADSCSAGVNVLRYRFYRVNEPHELFRGRLLSDLRDAVATPNESLYFPHGVPAFVREDGLCQ